MENFKRAVLFFVIILIHSCTKNSSTKKNPASDRKRLPESIASQKASIEDKPENKYQNTDFDVTTGSISDIVPKKYEIQYETEGDLNGDGWADAVLVLRKKSDTLASRTILVLLKNKNQSFRLDQISTTVFPDEYNEAGYKKYDPEDITIEKGILKINLYNPAPYGNLFSHFKYLNNDLVLIYIETYNVGAGSWQSLYYKPLKGKFTQEVTHTIEEEMPSKNKNIQVKKQRFLFDQSSPDEIISKVYSEHDVSDT